VGRLGSGVYGLVPVFKFCFKNVAALRGAYLEGIFSGGVILGDISWGLFHGICCCIAYRKTIHLRKFVYFLRRHTVKH